MKYKGLREEEIKNNIAEEYFIDFNCKKIIGNIDFTVTVPNENSLLESQSLFWAEAKKGSSDIFTSIVQLILTIGKARTFDDTLPPSFLGAFDAEKIAFIPYASIQEVFYQNDFNWNVPPSNHQTKEFKQVYDSVKNTIEKESLLFFFGRDDSEIEEFIQENFIEGRENFSKVQIDKNNFLIIYNKWLKAVKPTIAVNWEIAKKNEIFDSDFYLADLLSKDNKSIKDSLYVILEKDHYELARKINEMGMFDMTRTFFLDKQKAHREFWNKYQRPPKEQYWDYIIERRDLLVPQDIRERKGSFFTPQIWVELSQKYLADVLGEDWQEEYYIWDCAAGTGNLLAGLVKRHHIFASTLDIQDVNVMQDRIRNGANLLESHVFQFDFLNDSLDKLPKNLQAIINNPEERKKLIIYINPPYAEAGSVSVIGERKNKTKVATESKVWEKYKDRLGLAIRELFAQFFIRISQEIPDCTLASFAKLKYVNGNAFKNFRELFSPEYKSGFIMPANTFDNVRGEFPISFLVWDLENKKHLKKIKTDVYNSQGKNIGKKTFYANGKSERITNWIGQYISNNGLKTIGYTGNNGPDFQNNKYCHISSIKKINKNGTPNNATKYDITQNNIIKICIYFAVRHCISATWLNDRDQFLAPNKKWKKDTEFQNDCFAYTLFHGQNRITAEQGVNHWIPFTEEEVNASAKFESDFMTKFIQGKIKIKGNGTLLGNEKQRTTPLVFSPEAKEVFDAGRKLWKYYHSQPNLNVNASLYDIRMRFQRKNKRGRMNPSSDNETYTKLINNLRNKFKLLTKKIEPKVYEYGFLKK